MVCFFSIATVSKESESLCFLPKNQKHLHTSRKIFLDMNNTVIFQWFPINTTHVSSAGRKPQILGQTSYKLGSQFVRKVFDHGFLIFACKTSVSHMLCTEKTHCKSCASRLLYTKSLITLTFNKRLKKCVSKI